MFKEQILKISIRLGVVILFFLILFSVIAFARGYRIDFKQQNVTSTGIISVSAYPRASKVFINGTLRGVTDLNVTLPPGKYQVEVKKDGYTTWTRDVTLKGELVVTLDALMFPINPSLSPITNLGISKLIRVNSDRLLIFTENGVPEKDGAYLFELSKSPISFLPPLKRILKRSILPEDISFSSPEATFSPDSKLAVLTFPQLDSSISYLVNLEEENLQLTDVTNSTETLFATWEEDRKDEYKKLLELVPKDIKQIASDSFHIVSTSPDNFKILYFATQSAELPIVLKPRLVSSNQTEEVRSLSENHLYVYDKKEDRNYKISDKQLNSLAKDNPSVLWYYDSQHLVLKETDKVSMLGYDGKSPTIVYSGPFETDFFGVTPDGRLLILTNLNSHMNKYPDLYGIGIR